MFLITKWDSAQAKMGHWCMPIKLTSQLQIIVWNLIAPLTTLTPTEPLGIKQPYWHHCQNIDKATDSHPGRTDTHSNAAALRTWCLALRKVATIASMLNHYQNNGQQLWTSGNTQQSSHDIILWHNKMTTKHKMLQRMHWRQNWQLSMQSPRPTMLPQIQQTACELFTFLKLNHMPSPPRENAHKLLCTLIELCFFVKNRTEWPPLWNITTMTPLQNR